MVNDTRGHVSELLARSIKRGALDQDVTAEDKERMLVFLREYGDLTPDYLFKGTERSGFKVPPGAGKEDPVAIDPLPMARPARCAAMARADVGGRDRLAGHHVSARRRHGPYSRGIR